MDERSETWQAGYVAGREFRRVVGSSLAKFKLPRLSTIDSTPKSGSHHPYLCRSLDSAKGEIRLLHILPALPGETLRGTIGHAFVSLSPDSLPTAEYEAISYCWGDPAPRKKLVLDDVEIKIPSSAYAALKGLRLPSSIRTVWIDFLCINQDDITERGAQVALMTNIYRQCSKCVVWLGSEIDPTVPERAFEMLDMIRDAGDGALPLQLLRSPVYEGQFVKTVFASAKHAYKLAPLNKLYEKPWFTRKWTLQEVALPPEVVCRWNTVERPIAQVFAGAVHLATKVKAPTIFDDESTVSRVYKAYPLIACDQRELLGKTLTVREILTMVRLRESTDPKDAVFALLGLITARTNIKEDLFYSFLRPSYERSLEDVISSATKCCFYEERNLDAVVQVFPRRYNRINNVDSFPSWTPLWHLAADQILSHDRKELSKFFDASAGLPFGLLPLEPSWPEEDPFALQCRSTMIDTVKDVYKYLDRKAVQSPDELRELLHWLRSHMAASKLRYESDVEKVEAMAMTLTVGEKFLAPELATQEDIEAFAVFVDAIDGENPPQILRQIVPKEIVMEQVPEKELPLARSMANLQRASINRVVFVTDQGVLGMGPRNMAVGDTLALPHGSRWPVILRQKEADWELLEVCYAHGFMMGQQTWPQDVETRDMIITIR